MNADQKKWTEISIAYETEPSERTERQREIADYGLCGAWNEISVYPACDWGYDNLNTIADLPLDMGSVCDGWWPFIFQWDYTRQHDLYRATFAAFMAALSASDIKEMLNETR